MIYRYFLVTYEKRIVQFELRKDSLLAEANEKEFTRHYGTYLKEITKAEFDYHKSKGIYDILLIDKNFNQSLG